MADTSALASVPKMPVRAKQRKPVHQKKPELAQKTPEPEDAVPSKRQRRAPAWLAPSTFSIEAVPETLAEHLKKAEPDAKQRSQGGSRMTQWRLINKKCMVVEMEHQGVKYRGCMNRVGLAPTVGTVVEENYEPVKLVGGNDGELCAMCEKPLLQQLYPCEAELAQVVRCCVATNWVTHCHLTCGLWAPEVYEDSQGNLVNLASAIRRSRALRCMVCKGRGASLGCSHAGCQRVYHLACAHTGGCELNEEDFTLYCPSHCSTAHKRLLAGSKQH
ncbi:PHD-like zinc-binding domain-containing protein [Haematococcus lacustris]